MLFYFPAALAQTATVDSAEIRAMVDELQPRVEAHLGRPPIGPLDAGLLSHEDLRAALEAPAPAVGNPVRPTEGRLAADHVADGVPPDVRIAVYVGQTRGVYVVREAVDALLAVDGMSPEQLRPIVRCLVVHELVHAVQHAYGTIPVDVDPDVLDGWSALREGHATRVELDLCAAWEGPDIALRVAGLHGIDAPGTLAPRATATPYAWGRTLVNVLEATDPELVWAALAAPPPRWTRLVEDLRPVIGGGWQDPAPIAAALRAEGETPVVRSSGLQPLGSLLGVPGGLGLPLVSAGWIVETPTRVVATFRTIEPNLAAVIVDRRASLTNGSGAYLLTRGALEGDLAMDRGTVTALDGRGDVTRSLRLDLGTTTGAGAYHERWVATEHTLVLVVTRSAAGPAGDDEALATLLDTLPAGPAPTASVLDLVASAEWLDGVRAQVPALELTPGPQWRLLAAGVAWQAGNPEPCGPAFDAVLVPGALRDPQAQAAQAYVCAAAANETATADKAAALLGALPSIPAAIHARDLADAERVDEALAILERTSPAGANERRVVADTRMHALGVARRWRELVIAATDPEGSPSMRVQAALSLRQEGWASEATDLFASACTGEQESVPTACAER